MQKSARSTFSATAKDALLNEFKAIVNAGEVTMRSDSSTIAQIERTYHLDSHEVTRYTRAIESLNDRYGWHLDAQKTLSRLGKKLGKKCGGGWISPEKKCKSHYTDGKLNSSGKVSSADLADRIRSRKKMTAIRSRDGKMRNGQWDIGAAFAPGNEQQSSIRASRTGPNNNRTLNPDRAARMKAKEENRARINWGKTTGDWKQQPDSTAAMDMVKPKPRPTSTKGADYLTHPGTNEAMRKHEGVKKIAESIDFNGGVIDAGTNNRVGNFGVVKVVKLNPKSSSQRWGSATIEVDRGDGPERINVDLPTIADGVKKASRESSSTPTPTPIAVPKARPLKLYEQAFRSLASVEGDLKNAQANHDRLSQKATKGAAQAKIKVEAEIGKLKRRRENLKRSLSQTDIGGKQVRILGAGKDFDGATIATIQMAGGKKGEVIGASIRFHNGDVEHLPPATINGKIFNKDKAVFDHVKAHAVEAKDFADFVDRALPSFKKPVDASLLSEINSIPVQSDRQASSTPATPIASAKPLKDLFSEADRIGAKYSGPSTMAERRIARQEADRIMQESGATQAVGRAIGKVAMIDPARTPVRIPNQRRSNEPRKRGRSVD